jgi:site-specific DNA recombinase
MNAGIYNRVSTNKQLDNFSLEEQSRINQEYAARNGMHVAKEVTVDESASDLFRAGLDELLQMIEERQINALIVYGSDRLSRSTIDGLLLLESLAKSKVELHYATRGKVENTPEHRILHAVEFSMNEYWKFKLIQTMKRGRDGKLKDGVYIGNGVPTFGYTKIGAKRETRLEINEEEAEVVRQVFQWYVIEGWTMNQICRELTARGIATYNERYRPTMKSLGWTAHAVRNILMNRTYTGVATYNKMIVEEFYDPELKKKRQRVTRGTGREMEVSVPQIIDVALWQQAQERMQGNRNNNTPKREALDYLMRVPFHCSLCGRLISHRCTPKRKGEDINLYHYYYCRNTETPYGVKCALPPIRAETIDTAVWQHIRDLISDPRVTLEALHRSQQGAIEHNAKIRRLMHDAESLITKQEKEIDNILAMRIESASARTSTRLIQMQQDAEKLLEDLIARREAMNANLLPELDIEQGVEQITEFSQLLGKGLERADADMVMKRQILHYLKVTATASIEEGEYVLYLTCIIDPEGTPVKVSNKRGGHSTFTKDANSPLTVTFRIILEKRTKKSQCR